MHLGEHSDEKSRCIFSILGILLENPLPLFWRPSVFSCWPLVSPHHQLSASLLLGRAHRFDTVSHQSAQQRMTIFLYDWRLPFAIFLVRTFNVKIQNVCR